MIDEVEALVRDVAATVVVPRFRTLTDDEVFVKGPGDLVTVADREAESLLSTGLTALLPGSRVVGEEAAAADPSLLTIVRQPGAVWLVDPVDGTANFAAGREPFAIMVALLRDGAAVAAWILDPVSGRAGVAERGSGAYLDGVRVRMPTGHRPAHDLRGPAGQGRAVRPGSGTDVEILPGHNCIGYEYPAIVRDEQQFALFGRTLPWDHAPGVLFLEEAGGVAWRPDATPYVPADDRPGLLVAQSQEVWETVRASLLSPVPG